MAKGADGGDDVIREVREIPFVLEDKLRFGLVFTRRSPREFMAQVVHYLPERPKTLGGSIQAVGGVQTQRGYEIAGPILKYVQGGFDRLASAKVIHWAATNWISSLTGSLQKQSSTG